MSADRMCARLPSCWSILDATAWFSFAVKVRAASSRVNSMKRIVVFISIVRIGGLLLNSG